MRLVPLCLEVQAAPLTTSINVKWDDGLIRALLPHVPRISHPSLTGYASIEDEASIPPDFFNSPMPNLTLSELGQYLEQTQWFPPNRVHAPPLFQNVANLKFLHLTRIPIYPTLFGIKSLAELKLVGYKPPYQKFLEFLESNSNLEVIELNLGFPTTSALTAQQRVVSLPQLRHLALACNDVTSIMALLSCLPFHRGADIEVHGTPSLLPGPHAPVQDLLAPITTIKYLPNGLRLSGNDRSVSSLSHLWLQDGYKELDLFDTDAVREFHLSPIYYDYLSRPLGRLPGLEALVIPHSHKGLLSGLAYEPALCPSLKTIAFLDYKVDYSTIDELRRVFVKRERLISGV